MSHSVLIIGNIWPEPRSSAAGLRDWNLVELFLGAGWPVTYVSPSKPNEYSAALTARGVATFTYEANDSSFDRFIGELRPDFAIFDRFMMEEMFGWRVREHSPGTLRVLDTIDLHFLRRARMRAFEEGTALADIYAARIELQTDDALREVAAIYRSDLSLIISDYERELLVERFGVPRPLLQLFRFCYPASPEKLPSYDERRDFVMIGNFRHPPNADAVRWLHQEIWPLIRRESPAAEVHVYGAYPPREMMALDSPSTGFRVLGSAPDQFEVLRRYRVNLAPLRFGAGIKGKIADGWWSGTPVVTTPIGAEGMRGSGGFGGAVALDAAEVAQAALGLYSSREDWERASGDGHLAMRELFAERPNGEGLLRALAALHENAAAGRAGNFVGSMLWHHAHRSTTYFARWIEEKNRFSGKN